MIGIGTDQKDPRDPEGRGPIRLLLPSKWIPPAKAPSIHTKRCICLVCLHNTIKQCHENRCSCCIDIKGITETDNLSEALEEAIETWIKKQVILKREGRIEK